MAIAYLPMAQSDPMTPIETRLELKAALDALGSNMADASRKIGRGGTYLQQFIRYGKPEYLEERDRERLVAIFKIDGEPLKPPIQSPDPIEGPTSGASDRPRAGDPIKDSREATIVHTWRQVPEEEQNTVVAILNGILRARGLPPIAL